MGIIGYGDIGRAVAKLATVYGMRIVALRRHPFLSRDDPFCDVVYGRDKGSLNQLMSESDYIVCSTPSTVETRGMVNADAFSAVKQNAVFINLGRGPVVDEPAMIQALKSGKLKGAALDVFTEEPLPKTSELWSLPNVLISPHNVRMTRDLFRPLMVIFAVHLPLSALFQRWTKQEPLCMKQRKFNSAVGQTCIDLAPQN